MYEKRDLGKCCVLKCLMLGCSLLELFLKSQLGFFVSLVYLGPCKEKFFYKMRLLLCTVLGQMLYVVILLSLESKHKYSYSSVKCCD